MSFGLYVHIPYCLQKCHYCDFTTFDLKHEVSMKQYTQLILTELRARAKDIPDKSVTSIYFGGGTPSLLPAEDILAILREIASVGFKIESSAEITIEINPGTIDRQKLDLYLAAGVNRFSVGVQTFNPRFLAACGREHTALDSEKTLDLLREFRVNYSFDLLFGLPEQTLTDLKADLELLTAYSPPHVSLYNLTVPENHKMNFARGTDSEQAEMFELIETRLSTEGIARYELSNFAKPGAESRHNSLYWSDEGFWGLGVSAHSYLPGYGSWGARFWNPKTAREYISQLQIKQNDGSAFYDSLPAKQFEALRTHEALTDYCHTQLRTVRGLSNAELKNKFDVELSSLVVLRAERAVLSGLLSQTSGGYRLSQKGWPLANQVFLELTFLAEDILNSTH